MVRVRTHRDDANAARLAGAIERVGNGRASGSVRRSWREAQTEAWGSRDIRVHATGACILRHRERTIVLHPLLGAGLQNNAVVVDAVATTKHRFAMTVWIPCEADARTKVLGVGVL